MSVPTKLFPTCQTEVHIFMSRCRVLVPQLGMFRSLLHQLLSQVPAAGQEFYSLCDKKKRWQGDSGKDWDWRIEELREAFSFALIAAAKDHGITIFIDALDEAGDNASRE